MDRRVVITGIGAVTPVGNTAEDTWANMLAGVNGIDYITSTDVSDMAVKLSAEVKDFKPELYMDSKSVRRLDRFCQLSMAAGVMAMNDAGYAPGVIATPERFGVIIGSGIGGFGTIEHEVGVITSRGPKRVNPLFVPRMIANMAAGSLSMHYDLKGHSECVTSACATGANAVGDAFRLIKHGYQDAMLAGGAESAMTRLAFAGFLGITALSLSDDKDRASLPFDKERGGFVMGEGAGILVLEEYEHAKARGAHIYAEVLGYGAASDAYHMTAPHPEGEGAERAMRLALEEGNVTQEKVGYVNAHGTGTDYNDKVETMAINRVFEGRRVPVSSTKSMTGHMLGAAGAVESMVCALVIDRGEIPPTINYKVHDPECDLDVVPNESRRADVDYCMSNAFGFGGHDVSLLFGRVEN